MPSQKAVPNPKKVPNLPPVGEANEDAFLDSFERFIASPLAKGPPVSDYLAK